MLLQDWKYEGQKNREDIDCGLLIHKCAKCDATFSRAKDAAYHKNKCGKCQCTICSKTFSSQLSLKKHMNVTRENINVKPATKHLGVNSV